MEHKYVLLGAARQRFSPKGFLQPVFQAEDGRLFYLQTRNKKIDGFVPLQIELSLDAADFYPCDPHPFAVGDDPPYVFVDCDDRPQAGTLVQLTGKLMDALKLARYHSLVKLEVAQVLELGGFITKMIHSIRFTDERMRGGLDPYTHRDDFIDLSANNFVLETMSDFREFAIWLAGVRAVGITDLVFIDGEDIYCADRQTNLSVELFDGRGEEAFCSVFIDNLSFVDHETGRQILEASERLYIFFQDAIENNQTGLALLEALPGYVRRYFEKRNVTDKQKTENEMREYNTQPAAIAVSLDDRMELSAMADIVKARFRTDAERAEAL